MIWYKKENSWKNIQYYFESSNSSNTSTASIEFNTRQGNEPKWEERISFMLFVRVRVIEMSSVDM